MKQRVLIALLTIVVLGAGYLAGVWTERHSCQVPKPPALLGELSPAKPTHAEQKPAPPPNAAALAAEIERLRPQIDTFRTRLDEIDRAMDREIDAILRPPQHALFAAIVKHYANLRAKEAAANQLDAPLTPSEITALQQRPLYKMLAIIVVPLRLEWNVRDLKLDDAQKEKLRAILVRRREKFLALVDASPPPSLTLSQLAPAVERLIDIKK